MKRQHAFLYTTTLVLALAAPFGCKLTSTDNGGNTPTDPDTVDMAGEGLVLVRPNGGEQVTVGAVLTIRWGINFDRVLNGVNFLLSPNNGRTWAYLDPRLTNTIHSNDTTYYDGTHWGTYEWPVTDSMWRDEMQTQKIYIVSDSCKVKIYAPYDLDSTRFRWYEDASDEVFSIAQ